jgi:KRAB domain-containing zinc finger protein
MCEGCGKSFGHKWALIHHQRTHSRERPHNCHICSRAFTNNKDLRRHFSVHSGKSLHCHKSATDLIRKSYSGNMFKFPYLCANCALSLHLLY